MDLYPLKLSFHVRSYAFGDRLIPDRLGKRGVPDGIVAETWEVSDHRDARATIGNGPLTGTPLHALVEHSPDELVGLGWRGPHFPLLEKFLDASHMLPVHLHADDATARRRYREPNGKTEAWHILWAAAGATVLAGVHQDASLATLRTAFLAQDYDAVMDRFPIRAGDTVYVRGGALHSFGPDTLIFELQQTSDLAQTVMPTDLYGTVLARDVWEANIERTLEELRPHLHPRPHPGLVVERDPNQRTVGCAGPHFSLERWRLRAPHHEAAHPHRCLTLTNLADPVEIRYAGGVERLERAESCILPAALGECRIAPTAAVADLIACTVPDLLADVVAPLRAAGHDDRAIAGLGEVAMV